MSDKLRWGIIGTGNIANEFASQFNTEFSTLAGVASRNAEKANQFAKKYRIEKSYSNYQALIDDKEIDVVYIATPHNLHYDTIFSALDSGKHVVSEKVIVTDSDQLVSLIDKAKQEKVLLFEAMTIHYMPIYQEVKQYIKKHDLGPLKMIQVNFGSFKITDQSYYFFNKELAGGALFDIGVYALNFIRYFLTSKPEEIKTLGFLNDYGVDEASGIVMRNKENELATVTLTFRAKLPKQGIVAFEKGYFTISNYPRADEATFTSVDGQEQIIKSGHSNKGLSYEVKEISRLILNNEENPYLTYTSDVLNIMDSLRKEWGLVYSFDK